ncbi:phosphatidylglycerophosphatase A [Candidatus Magnetaquicoccus inordinatus]|uniref:phosphatidylglycerophosphatase A family protein n=1 Tax=Candidatus Magnetaquicoccus inordinatus TaxID=2496818 RepID=UPI00102C2570|nr:phosphatidylglycerophosphatase A [Candidatus Magnetaquicoccus inordinatus]
MVESEKAGVKYLALHIATLGGVGLLPKAPGTWGTVATVPFAWLVKEAGSFWYWLALLLLSVLGSWATSVACRHFQRKDPSQVVVDEAAGLWVTLLFLPEGWVWWLVGVVLFRLFDIFKPWPVNWLDRELPSPWGVMADDLAAGLYAGLSMTLLARIISL